MKRSNWIASVFLAAVLALAGAGCSKSEPPPKPPEHEGVVIDMPKLQKAFEKTTQETYQVLAKVNMGIRYNRYMDALEGLDKLANDPSVTPEQKKVVNEVIEQVKKALENQAANPPPAQQ